MRRVLAIATMLGACGAAFLLTGADEDDAALKHYRVEFDNAFGLVAGGDVKVGGVRAGQTTGFEISDGHPRKAIVEIEISEPGFDSFRADARCAIKPQSLIGEYFVDCQPGSSPKELPEGATLPVEQTTGTINQDLINNIFRRPYRERLRLIIAELGTGLAGRPEELANVLRRAHPGLRETTEVLRILARQNRIIEDFIRDSDTVVEQLERRKREVARWVAETGETAETSASRAEDIERGFERLPVFLEELRPTMARLGELAGEQTPLLSDLRRGAPDLTEFLERLEPFSESSRPAFRTLGRASVVGTRAFREGAEEIAELRALAKDAPPLAKPLRQFLQTMDDRRRAIEDDPRAPRTAPPAPDPTAVAEGDEAGFTGLEGIWQYFFWQALSLNGFDDVSHMLAVTLIANDCSAYRTGPITDENREVFERCNQWLGPYQPGVNPGDEDPTATTSALARARALDRRPARTIGERRGPGEPAAGPLPGQRDISRPQIALPPELQELFDALPGLPGRSPDAPALRDPPDTDVDPLLDYLLGG